MSLLGFIIFITLVLALSFHSVLPSLFSSVFTRLIGKQKLAPFVCDHCAERFTDPQDLVDHLWTEHRHPAEIRVNGRVYRSGPSAVLDRYLLRLWASRKLR